MVNTGIIVLQNNTRILLLYCNCCFCKTYQCWAKQSNTEQHREYWTIKGNTRPKTFLRKQKKICIYEKKDGKDAKQNIQPKMAIPDYCTMFEEKNCFKQSGKNSSVRALCRSVTPRAHVRKGKAQDLSILHILIWHNHYFILIIFSSAINSLTVICIRFCFMKMDKK